MAQLGLGIFVRLFSVTLALAISFVHAAPSSSELQAVFGTGDGLTGASASLRPYELTVVTNSSACFSLLASHSWLSLSLQLMRSQSSTRPARQCRALAGSPSALAPK